MLIGAEHAVGQALILIERADHARGRLAIGRLLREEIPERGGLQTHRVVYAVGIVLGLLVSDFADERKVGEQLRPIEALAFQLAGEIQQFRIAGPVVEPDDAREFVLPAVDRPTLEGQRSSMPDW